MKYFIVLVILLIPVSSWYTYDNFAKRDQDLQNSQAEIDLQYEKEAKIFSKFTLDFPRRFVDLAYDDTILALQPSILLNIHFLLQKIKPIIWTFFMLLLIIRIDLIIMIYLIMSFLSFLIVTKQNILSFHLLKYGNISKNILFIKGF